jgi:hypothetical protein
VYDDKDVLVLLQLQLQLILILLEQSKCGDRQAITCNNLEDIMVSVNSIGSTCNLQFTVQDVIYDTAGMIPLLTVLLPMIQIVTILMLILLIAGRKLYNHGEKLRYSARNQGYTM